jgi:hypothetical protein
MERIEIIKKDISPLWIKIVGATIFLATIYKIVSLTFFDVSPLVYLIMNLIAVVIWTGKEVVVVDFAKQEIGEGFRILGLTHLDRTKFSGLEKIFINRVHTGETFRHLTRTMDIHHVNFKAFLKTTNGDKICVGIHRDKEVLIRRLRQYNARLRTSIFDTTSTEPTIVE